MPPTTLTKMREAQPPKSFTVHRPKALGLSVTSPTENTTRKSVLLRVAPVVQIFYIGGAGDKRGYPITLPGKPFGPYGNIEDVKNIFSGHLIKGGLYAKFSPTYLGYYEIYGDDRIKSNVVTAISDKRAPIILIGHSLGGWNAAHLSNWLNAGGYRVEMLVTLDPVGEGFMVTAASDIYSRSAHVAAKTWINIRAEAKTREGSDIIADLGGQWEVKNGPTINAVVDVSHANAVHMFYAPLNEGPSAAALVMEAIRRLSK